MGLKWASSAAVEFLDFHLLSLRGDHLGALAENRLRQHGGRRSAVTGDVRRLRRNFAHHLRAEVLELVFQIDFLGDGNAVLGHRGGGGGSYSSSGVLMVGSRSLLAYATGVAEA